MYYRLIGDISLLSEALEEETKFKNVSLIYGSLTLGKTEDAKALLVSNFKLGGQSIRM
jgi:hypothetical protein